MHYLKMRNVDLAEFYANPNDPIHSCRMQDHMKLQRHIHSMDALRHLLTTAEGENFDLLEIQGTKIIFCDRPL